MEEALRLLEEFAVTFVPIFVAMDPVGTAPIFLSLSRAVEETERPKVLSYAIITALGIGLGFILLGRLIFLLLDITVADFLIAGGLVLLVIATTDLLLGGREQGQTYALGRVVGVVPLGTPLIAGPAVLTTLLLLIGQYPYLTVVLSFLLNLAIAWAIFASANRLTSFLGTGGVQGLSKVIHLLLAAIAVKMIRQGVLQILGA